MPPPRTGRSGRPRTRGARLGTPADLAAGATAGARWRATRVRRYGRTDTVQITEMVCLWYGSFRSRTGSYSIQDIRGWIGSCLVAGLLACLLDRRAGSVIMAGCPGRRRRLMRS